jgi:hypothetical protein
MAAPGWLEADQADQAQAPFNECLAGGMHRKRSILVLVSARGGGD